MDLLIAILKLAAALASLAAGIIRVLSAASESKHDEKRKRSLAVTSDPLSQTIRARPCPPKRALPSVPVYPKQLRGRR